MANGAELKREIIDKELCTRCGTCMGICPTSAINFENDKIILYNDKCIQCGKCLKVCPGKEFSFKQWSGKLFGEEYHTNDVLGNYKSIWNVRTNKSEIYQSVASGGAITQICMDLLSTGLVTGIVGIKAEKNNPCGFEPFIARTWEELLLASQSKYMVIPTNKIIQLLKKEHGKIAFVGLPCQIHGLRKAMDIDAHLKETVLVLISLFCGFNMERTATKYLINKSRIREDDIERLEYRHKNGNETGFYIKGKKDKAFFVNKHSYTFMNLIYSPKRCWKCFDYSGEFADISVGDAWDQSGGSSRVVIRTDTGKKIFENSLKLKTINAEESNYESILKTQRNVIGYKKKSISIRKKMMKTFPDYDIELPESNGKEKIKGCVLYFIMAFFKTTLGKVISKFIPFHILSVVSNRIKGKEIK